MEGAMDERTGVLLSAVLMLIAALRGTDADVKQAASGHIGLAYLAGKYGDEMDQVTEAIKRIFATAPVTADKSASTSV